MSPDAPGDDTPDEIFDHDDESYVTSLDDEFPPADDGDVDDSPFGIEDSSDEDDNDDNDDEPSSPSNVVALNKPAESAVEAETKRDKGRASKLATMRAQHLMKNPDFEAMSRNEIIRRLTIDTLIDVAAGEVKNTPTMIERSIIESINTAFDSASEMLSGGGRGGREARYAKLVTLLPVQIAEILIRLHDVCTISTSEINEERSYDLVAMYATSGTNEGLYVTSEEEIRRVARQYNYDLSIQGFKEITSVIRDGAPRRFRCLEPNIIAVNNGLFDYETKQLLPFNKDKVFLCKSRINYNPNAENVEIAHPEDGTIWNIEDWMASLSDDEGIPELLWEICGAVLRPNVSWDKAAFFYAESGSNGKGTVCTLLRNLCGPGAHASVAIADMGKDFMLEQLVGKQAIIVDENDVGLYLDKAANLKTIITQDILQINRKHKSAVSYRFQGFMVQCLNDEPKIRDKSDSLYRRQLFIPMNKRFTGIERKYIKNDYLRRKDVLEYALKRVLHMDYEKLSEPPVTKEVLEEYKVSNDPVREFFEEYQYQFVWDGLPFSFLYDAYRAWFAHNVPSGSALSKRNFSKDIKKIVEKNPLWTYDPEDLGRFTARSLMIGAEPLIADLQLKSWMNTSYRGDDIDEICTPRLAVQYRGIVRRSVMEDHEWAGTSVADDVIDEVVESTPIEHSERIESTTDTDDETALARVTSFIEAPATPVVTAPSDVSQTRESPTDATTSASPIKHTSPPDEQENDHADHRD